MAVTVNEDTCIACGACADACPVDAITIADHAVVNADECIDWRLLRLRVPDRFAEPLSIRYMSKGCREG